MVLAGGRYELGAVVGTGGMAQVRRATDTVLGREVAVKIFREDLDDDSAARARTEMQTLASLTHRNLVAVHDAGTFEHGQPFLVMELVEGPTLAECCVDGSLTPQRISEIGADLADALAYVHGQGVVHRDVKPANVLLSKGGAKLADFGIARIVDGARHTGTGLTVGTAPYLSPEQVTGQLVGPPADVYALGLVLLECFTGRREYTGSAVETAMARLHRQPEVPHDLPDPWPELLPAMTARQPEHRPTAADVLEALRGGGLPRPALDQTMQTQVLNPATRVALRLEPASAGDVVEQPGRSRVPLVAACLAAGALVIAAVVASGSDAPSATPTSTTSTAPSGSPASPGSPGSAGSSLEQQISDLQDAVRR